MTPDARPPRRDGWPWPASPQPSAQDDFGLRESEALVHATALAVAHLTEELRLAMARLDEAQAEARVASACIATREATEAIARARRRPA